MHLHVEHWRSMRSLTALVLALGLSLGLAACASQEEEEAAAPAMAPVPANDNLNAVLWTQRSVEFKGNAWTAYKLAMIRLDQALANRRWTGVPAEQTGSYRSLPPAVILDVDETVLDNSDYQAWNVTAGTSFDPKTWTSFVNSQTSRPIPGALEFTEYAAKKGVKVFYVTNRVAEEEAATRANLAKYGFPLDASMDTSPRSTGSCSTSATTSATSPTTIRARMPSACRSSRRMPITGARNGLLSPIRPTARSSRHPTVTISS